MSKNDLVSIDLVSGVGQNGNPFVTVSCVSEGKGMFVGQLDPKTLREHGVACFEAAEAAETDAILFKLLQEKFGLSLDVVGALITDIRNAREE